MNNSGRSNSEIIIVIFVIVFLFFSCNPDDKPGTLDGVWYDGHANVIIDLDKTIKFEGNYKGEIANSPNFTAANGVLIIQFTKYFDWGEMDYSTTHENVGQFGALYWADLKAESVLMADAWFIDLNNFIFEHVVFETLGEALAAFTPAADKRPDYVSWTGKAPYIKQ